MLAGGLAVVLPGPGAVLCVFLRSGEVSKEGGDARIQEVSGDVARLTRVVPQAVFLLSQVPPPPPPPGGGPGTMWPRRNN